MKRGVQEKLVREEKFWAAYLKFETLAHGEGVFDPEYVAEKTRRSVTAHTRQSAGPLRRPNLTD